MLSTLDLEATPPFDHAHDHFGYRDRLSQPAIEGTGDVPTPGSGAPLKPGEFFLGYPDEAGMTVPLPQPEVLSRNGSFLAYRRMEEHVGRFREFLEQHGETPEEQELVAAKLMGRWRSGAPLVLAPERTTRRSAPIPSGTTTSTTPRGSPWLCRAAGLARAPHEPARHRREHEPAPDDPPRRHLRAGAARGRPG